MSLILTKAGLAAYAQAEATGIKLQATHMAVGDGNGEAVAHTSDSLVLVNEVWRGALQEITVAPSGEVEFIAHVPVTVGGWYIRELAVYGADTLLAVGAHPELWKPDPTAPDKVELEITAPIKFDNAATLNLVVDTTKVLASQSHVAGKIAEHDAAPEAHGNLLADKADVDHTHEMPDVSGLGAALAGKAEAGHTHLAAQVTDLFSSVHAWSRQQYFGAVPLAIVDGSIAWNLNNAQCSYVVLDRDAFLAFPTNVSNGGQYRLRVIQDATGGHVLSYSAGYKPAVEGDDLPEVATGPGAVTLINGDSDGSDMRIA
jgi:hypothetical protein